MSNCWQIIKKGSKNQTKYKTLDLALQQLSYEVNIGNSVANSKIKYLYSNVT